MSTRHKPGDLVRISAQRWQIQPDGSEPWCYRECGDDDCEEWATLWEIGDDSKPTGRVAYHVCDCEMTDAP